MLSEFSILPSDSAQLQKPHWSKRIDMFLSGADAAAGAQEPDGEEEDDYKHLTAELCRIYSHAPREFTVIDRVRKTKKSRKIEINRDTTALSARTNHGFKLNSCGQIVCRVGGTRSA
jgi:hypothetical protein